MSLEEREQRFPFTAASEFGGNLKLGSAGELKSSDGLFRHVRFLRSLDPFVTCSATFSDAGMFLWFKIAPRSTLGEDLRI